MSELKTKPNNSSVMDFINSVADEVKRNDSLTLLKIYKRLTHEDPKMWGDSIIGFGQYHYKSERSRQEGDWPLAAFSPRKQNLSLYVMPGFADYKHLLTKLGTHKTSVGCLYIKRLSDVDQVVLEKIIKQDFEDAKRKLT